MRRLRADLEEKHEPRAATPMPSSSGHEERLTHAAIEKRLTHAAIEKRSLAPRPEAALASAIEMIAEYTEK
jgi:hypothetical protein